MTSLPVSPPLNLGPVPPWNNPIPTPQNFQPSRFVISNITLGITTIVTTSVNNNYVVGQEVRLLIPASFGCRQLNGQSGFVISLPAPNQVEISIDSYQNVDQFISSSALTKPQIVAIGDVNTGIISSTGPRIPSTNIPGSFINIS